MDNIETEVQFSIKLPPLLVDKKILCQLLSISPATVEKLIRKSNSNFPQPVLIETKRLWRIEDIKKYAKGL